MSSQKKAVKTHNVGERISYNRIVVKAGTSLLTGGTERLDLETMSSVVGQIARLHAKGKDMILVSSGAVAAGRHVLRLSRGRKNLPLRQALAAVGQSHLMHAYEQLFSWHEISVAQALLSRRDISDRLGYLNVRNTLWSLLERRVVPIVNENDVVAVEEITGEAFGDNDTLSALVANLVDADLLVMLGEVNGVFTSDPNVDPDAALIPVMERVSDSEIISLGGPSWGERGRGGMATKLEAARMAAASGVDVVIASGRQPNVLSDLVSGESVGTFFPNTSTKMESRKRWMLSELSTENRIVVDTGAVKALTNGNSSLLPIGITEVPCPFDRGEIVAIVDSSATPIAVGITNYDSGDLSRIKREHSERIGDILGHHYGDEAIHRNNMVIL